MVKRTKTLVATSTLALVLAGTGAGIAAAQTTTPSAPSGTTTASPATGKHAGKHADRLKGVEHGVLTVKTKTGDQVVDVQRGVVTAVDAGSVTVRSTDGFSATYTLDASTKVRKDAKTATASDVAVNDTVRVRATVSGSTATAQRLEDKGAGTAK